MGEGFEFLTSLFKKKKGSLYYGRVAEWLCRGLQILVRRFDSGLGLQKCVVMDFFFCYTTSELFKLIQVFLGSSVVEQAAVNRSVAGSSPARGANLSGKEGVGVSNFFKIHLNSMNKTLYLERVCLCYILKN